MSYHKYVENRGNAKHEERIFLGTSEDGIVLYVTKKGIEINGYYTRRSSEAPDALLRKSLTMSWDDLEKLRSSLSLPKKKKKEELIGIESPISDDELKKLPKVNLNGNLYYVDIVNKIIRPCDKPNTAYEMQH